MNKLSQRAHRIALINHKGGVGKTTLTINLAVALCELGKRVLIVDADPQCNVTTHFLDEAVVDELLDNSEKAAGATIWSALHPTVTGDSDVKPAKSRALYHPRLHLVPGDIRLAAFEEELSDLWAQCFRRKVRGIRGTTALSRSIDSLERSLALDYIFYDTGPNIGPLNRVIALDCSHFITPVACDLFSLHGIKTLGHSLASWIQDWATASQLAPETEFVFSGRPQFIGYLPQSFRIYAGDVAQNSAAFLPKLERKVRTEIVARLEPLALAPPENKPLKIASIKHFGHLVPQAQTEGCSLWDVDSGNANSKADASAAFRRAAQELIVRTTVISL